MGLGPERTESGIEILDFLFLDSICIAMAHYFFHGECQGECLMTHTL